jgi:phage N-6-adenine-methyltransferase
VNRGMMTSRTCEWATPLDLFSELDREFQFTLDVCATAENAKCARFFTKAEDGLAQDWGRNTCWMNPPYGSVIGQWMRKAMESAAGGATVVCLVPARTDTAWWHDFAARGQVRFLRGRVRFSGVGPAPFPSAIVVFPPTDEAAK